MRLVEARHQGYSGCEVQMALLPLMLVKWGVVGGKLRSRIPLANPDLAYGRETGKLNG